MTSIIRISLCLWCDFQFWHQNNFTLREFIFFLFCHLLSFFFFYMFISFGHYISIFWCNMFVFLLIRLFRDHDWEIIDKNAEEWRQNMENTIGDNLVFIWIIWSAIGRQFASQLYHCLGYILWLYTYCINICLEINETACVDMVQSNNFFPWSFWFVRKQPNKQSHY